MNAKIFVLIALACCAPACKKPVVADPNGPIKNVILMIGDGMGLHQVSQAVYYRQLAHPDREPLAFEQLYRQARTPLVATYSANSVTTDSAAGATAMACGVKTKNGAIGVDAHENPCRSIIDFARDTGRSVGLVSTTRVTHATPAAFYAHIASRTGESEIAAQFVDAPVELMLSGGGGYFIPATKDGAPFRLSMVPECKGIPAALDAPGRLKNARDLFAEARAKGIHLACGKNSLPEPGSLAPGARVLGIFGPGSLPMIQERSRLPFIPDLAAMTRYSLDMLGRNERGFFLMVEGGLIDYAGHFNDAATQLQETLDFDRSIRVALAFVAEHPETLLIVTADHETGGFAMSYFREADAKNPGGVGVRLPGKDIFDLYEKQTVSFRGLLEPIVDELYPDDNLAAPAPAALDRAARRLHDQFRDATPWALSFDEAKRVLNPDPAHDLGASTDYPGPWSPLERDMFFGNRLGRMIATRTHAVWAAGNHSHTPVQAFILHPQSPGLPGLIQNTDLFDLMRDALANSP